MARWSIETPCRQTGHLLFESGDPPGAAVRDDERSDGRWQMSNRFGDLSYWTGERVSFSLSKSLSLSLIDGVLQGNES